MSACASRWEVRQGDGSESAQIERAVWQTI